MFGCMDECECARVKGKTKSATATTAAAAAPVNDNGRTKYWAVNRRQNLQKQKKSILNAIIFDKFALTQIAKHTFTLSFSVAPSPINTCLYRPATVFGFRFCNCCFFFVLFCLIFFFRFIRIEFWFWFFFFLFFHSYENKLACSLRFVICVKKFISFNFGKLQNKNVEKKQRKKIQKLAVKLNGLFVCNGAASNRVVNDQQTKLKKQKQKKTKKKQIITIITTNTTQANIKCETHRLRCANINSLYANMTKKYSKTTLSSVRGCLLC